MGEPRDNLNPTPEARLAMALWSREYAFEQNGGSMDFWRAIGASRQRLCRDVLRDVAKAAIAHGISLESLVKEPRP